MPNVSLTPQQTRFLEASVASGRCANTSEAVRHAIRLLQDAEERRERFTAMLEAVSAEADREGTVSIGEMDAELEAIIVAAEARA